MGRGRKRKTVPANQGAGVPVSKIPRVSSQFDTGDSETPVWVVRDIDLDGPFGWRKFDKELFLAEVLPKIQNFETMTWGEILGPKSHAVSVGSLSKEAQKRLVERKLDDEEQLISLRLTGLNRIWGIRRQRVLRLLWWDPNHEVCPSTKKHR